MSNTSDFIMMKEDHTLGNLISEYLKLHPHVLMAGYKGEISVPCLRRSNGYHSSPPMLPAGALTSQQTVAHPNVPEVLLRVQTDGTLTPKDAMVSVCKQLIAAYGQLGREFTREYELRRMVAAGEQQGNNPANGNQ